MRLPAFNAEASLAPASTTYRSSAVGIAATGDGVQLQAFPGRFGFTFRCCRRAPWLGGRFVCVTHQQSPFETCRCVSGQFGPIILCEPIVATQSLG